jgi:hypothetical protein
MAGAVGLRICRPEGRAVVTAEAYGGAVIVKLVELHAEAPADRHHHLGEQCASIRIEQSVERAPDPVVAHMLDLLGTDAEHPAGETMHRLLLEVDWFFGTAAVGGANFRSGTLLRIALMSSKDL